MKSTFEKFIRFEEENCLFKSKHRDTYYWHLIRTWVYYSILKDTSCYDDLKNKQGTAPNIARKIATVASNSLINLKQFPYRKNRCDVLFSNMYDYRKVNGEDKDIFIDFFDIDRSITTKKFEYNDQFHISNKADINSCYSDFRMILNYSFYKLRKMALSSHEQISFNNLVEKINKEFEVNLSKDVVINRILYSMTIWKSYYYSMRDCLEKINPKIVVMVNAYGLRHFATTKAAKDLGIATVELQHGVIAPLHIDYNFSDIENSHHYFPDYIFTFGQYWNGACRTPAQCKKIGVGYAYIDYIEGQLEEGMSRDLDTIVFYSTQEVKFAEFVGRFADLISVKGYTIIFKYHPIECGKISYPSLNKQNIQVIDEPEEVHKYLSNYEHHVSVGSTVLFEAAIRGASIYVLNEAGKEYMEELLDSGYGSLIENENDLFQRISEFHETKNKKVVKLLLEKNANRNINEELLKILAKKERLKNE